MALALSVTADPVITWSILKTITEVIAMFDTIRKFISDLPGGEVTLALWGRRY